MPNRKSAKVTREFPTMVPQQDWSSLVTTIFFFIAPIDRGYQRITSRDIFSEQRWDNACIKHSIEVQLLEGASSVDVDHVCVYSLAHQAAVRCARAVIMMTDDCHFLFVGDSNDHRAKSFKMNLSAKLTPYWVDV